MRRIRRTVVLSILLLVGVAFCIGQSRKVKSDTSKAKMEHMHMGDSTRSGTMNSMVSKDSLISLGKYNCCLKNPCDQCYREGENCECYTMVKKSKEVCKECYQGWQKGEGRVPGIKKEQVKAED